MKYYKMEVQRWAIRRETGEKVHINESYDDETYGYRCIHNMCGEKVHTRKGTKNQWHYAHYKGTQCKYVEPEEVINPRDEKENPTDDEHICNEVCHKNDLQCDGCGVASVCYCDNPNYELVKINGHLWCKNCNAWKCRCENSKK
jgi:hypothetical protein